MVISYGHQNNSGTMPLHEMVILLNTHKMRFLHKMSMLMVGAHGIIHDNSNIFSHKYEVSIIG